MRTPKKEESAKNPVPSFRHGVGIRLREAEKRFKNRADAAKAAGVAKSTLQNWIEGKTDPSFEGIVRLAQAANISVAWLATGEDEMGPEATQTEVPSAGFVKVPRFDVETLAGPDALTDPDNVVDFVTIRESWVRGVVPVDPSRLALITAVGDSMEPTVRAGDILLIDTGVRGFLDEAIYAVAFGDHILVKRIEFLIDGAVLVKNDNTAYVDQTLSAKTASQARVAGRVRWIGRML